MMGAARNSHSSALGRPVNRDIAVEVGRALRKVRMQRGLRLKDVAASSGSFTPTAVAGYERAERAITLQKFCALCAVYGVAPERLLAVAIRASEGRPPVVVDLSKVERLGDGEADFMRAFLDRVQARRREPTGQLITLRAWDVEVLATVVDKPPDELLAEVGVDRTALS